MDLPFFLEHSGVLAAFTHSSHIETYAPGDSLSCRLPEYSMILGIYVQQFADKVSISGLALGLNLFAALRRKSRGLSKFYPPLYRLDYKVEYLLNISKIICLVGLVG